MIAMKGAYVTHIKCADRIVPREVFCCFFLNKCTVFILHYCLFVLFIQHANLVQQDSRRFLDQYLARAHQRLVTVL